MIKLIRAVHLGDLALSSFQSLPASATFKYGYPSLGNETVILCDAYGDDLPPCTRQQFLQGVIEHPPVNPPWYTPTYSNLAYAILGLAFEAATGGSFVEAADNIFQNKLGMISTSVNAPTGDYDAIIPRNDSYAIFTYNIGIEGPAGNQYTSIKDLKTWAQAIWNNKLLDPALTRKWLKPVTFTSRFQSAVGVSLLRRKLTAVIQNPTLTVVLGSMGDQSYPTASQYAEQLFPHRRHLWKRWRHRTLFDLLRARPRL